MELIILGVLVIIELIIILYLFTVKKKKVKEVSFNYNDQLRIQKQKISAFKIQAEKSKSRNVLLETKIQNLEGKILEIENINRDLINKKEELAAQKQKLEILQKRKDEMFAIAIHDIKNPLAAIKSYLELLESYDLSVQLQYDIIKSMMESSDQIFRLTNEISEIIPVRNTPAAI